ncbi:hypothetical protein A1O3_00187 [Capronia epimyces CBS 606.96]|uniref:Flavin-nucleotide-binding protein n=1 Tax=Capronia epimyces CBS 606.96 TaxID=1182542 RepID=W9YFH3_9EURO|nr:uncharacterized protein A1O3_00187 [Capronia epimyces CBS 606.96]EXJ91637.1 hypothetical protein A1O3_00187 [Capronia epimyces CBS 606.96]
MGRTLEYPKGPLNTVKRAGLERGKYELGLVHSIIQTSLVLDVSFTPSPEDEFPAILPMIGAMGSFDNPSSGLDEPLDCYLHGYVSNRMNNLVRKAQSEGKPGLPVCIAANRVDGLVLALSGFHHSMNYRSACLFGYANVVTDPQEVLYGMTIITDKVVQGRWDNTRLPPTKADISSTAILRVTIKTGSGKVRNKVPGDDKEDMENEDLLNRVWTGYVPVTETLGEPVPSAYNRVKEVPGYLAKHREEYNDAITTYSEDFLQKMKN